MTAALVDRLLVLGGWERPWDVVRLDPRRLKGRPVMQVF